MKKLLLALSVASLFAAPVMAEEDEVLDMVDVTEAKATVSSTNVNIQGQLEAPTCSIKTEDQNQTVQLDTLLTTDFAEGVTSKKEFQISLERCPNVKKQVSLHFKVPTEQLDQQYLKNAMAAASNGAKGVSLKVTQGEELIKLGAAKGEQGVAENPSNPADITYKFNVEYVESTSADDAISAGLIEATLPVEVIYK